MIGAVLCSTILTSLIYIGVSLGKEIKNYNLSRKANKSEEIYSQSLEEVKRLDLKKNLLFNAYIEICLKLKTTYQKLEKLQIEYQNLSFKEKELGSLTIEFYNEWKDLSPTDCADDIYIKWETTNKQYKETVEKLNQILIKIYQLKEEYKIIEEEKYKAYNLYISSLSSFDKVCNKN